MWFNQPWLEGRVVPGARLRLRGQVRRREFQVKSYDIGEGSATADFSPVYPATEDVTPKRLRTLVEHALARVRDVPDPLPAALRQRERLPQRRDALVALHQPRSLDEAEAGRARLAFDELLVLQLGIARAVREREATVALALGEPGELIARYREALPFELTRTPGAGDRRDRRGSRAEPCRCSASCRATSARARPSSRSTRCCAPWRRATRAR